MSNLGSEETIDELIRQVRHGYITKESVINISDIFTKCFTKNHIDFLLSFGSVSPHWHSLTSLVIIQRILNITKIQILEYVIPKLNIRELSRSYRVCHFVPYNENTMKDLLWISCYIGSTYAVQSILSKGLKPNYGQWYGGEETPFPLIVACKYGYDEIIKLLILHGAKYDSESYYFGVGCMKLYLESKAPSIDIVKMLSSQANILYNLDIGIFHKDNDISSFFNEEYRKMGPKL